VASPEGVEDVRPFRFFATWEEAGLTGTAFLCGAAAFEGVLFGADCIAAFGAAALGVFSFAAFSPLIAFAAPLATFLPRAV
jgi:hypothetical protein